MDPYDPRGPGGQAEDIADFVNKRREAQRRAAEKLVSKKSESEVPSCEGCGTRTSISYAPSPFAQDVHGDDTPCWLCDECSAQQADDI